jgi:dTDP-4-amino-4,6-dideoxy-D-galactose acyltransferase
MGPENLIDLAAGRTAALFHYSPYYFLRHLSRERQQELFGAGRAARWGQSPTEEIIQTGSNPSEICWLLNLLGWDSEYFATPTYRVFTGLFTTRTSAADLLAAAKDLRRQLAVRHGNFYAFSVVPAEDVQLLQALTGAGWQLVETRLTYYHNQLSELTAGRHAVRAATLADAARIGQIAATARNPYDRLHADARVDDALADAYVGRYAENTIAAGLATTVLVPNEPALLVDSFLAISDLESDAAALHTRLSRVLLTAVGPANRGWHLKLVAETLHRARLLQHEAVLMTTQATNHAVFRTSEKLGFRLGATSHVLACHGL